MSPVWGVGGKVDATLAYKCPTCGAVAGEICTYVAAPAAARWPYNADRVGKPTRVPHRDRYRAMHSYQGTQSQVTKSRIATARREARLGADARAIARVFAVRDAIQAQDRRDYDELYAWVKDYGHILCR
jgi:hypothetical protein